MITVAESRVIDKNANFLGISSSQLMEQAGRSLAEVIYEKFQPQKVAIICGPGNNGGDGFVAARYLAAHCQVSLVLITDAASIKTELAKNNFLKTQGLDNVTIDKYNSKILTQQDIILDAMLGSGLSSNLQEPYCSIVDHINTLTAPVVSVDIPTGFGGTVAVSPVVTITFHDTKEGMTPQNCGEIIIQDIGIPPKAVTHVGPGDLHYYPRPEKASHKGQNGRVLVIGGGDYTGAPALVAMAILRTGADLAYVATPQRCWATVASFSPNLIVTPLPDTLFTLSCVPEIEEMIPRVDCLVVGPGLGRNKETLEAVKEVLNICHKNNKPVVVDADAIGALPDIKEFGDMVITPHAREFKELTGQDPEISHIQAWAQSNKVTLLVKGPTDIISDGNQVKLNDVHTVGMTVGGTGDVLAGIVGALLGKGVTAFNAARMGAFINGMAGLLSFQDYSYGMIATDVVDKIPRVLKNYL